MRGRAEDCGLVLQVIAGKDGKDPGSAGKSFYYTPQYARPMKDLKVGFAPWISPSVPQPRAGLRRGVRSGEGAACNWWRPSCRTFPTGP